MRELTGGRGVDVALEATGGDMLDRTLGVLAPFGRCVVHGYTSRTQLAVPVTHRFALADAAKAHEVLESRAVTGKLVLKPWEDVG